MGFKEFKKLVRDKIRPMSLDLVSTAANIVFHVIGYVLKTAK